MRRGAPRRLGISWLRRGSSNSGPADQLRIRSADTGQVVRRWGEGPGVLCIHGLGASSRYWQSLADELTGHTLIAPDLLGFGLSAKPATSDYSVEAHVRALAPLVPCSGIVVGHSAGAVLAGALAAHLPDRVRGLLLLGLPAYPDEDTARADIGRLGKLPGWTVNGSPLARAVCRLMCSVRPLAIGLAPLVVRGLPPAVVADGARHTWRSYSQTLEHVLVAHRTLPDLRTARVPTVLLHGRDDTEAPLAHVERLANDLERSGVHVDLRTLDGDHHVPVHAPAEVVRALTDLLDQVGRAR